MFFHWHIEDIAIIRSERVREYGTEFGEQRGGVTIARRIVPCNKFADTGLKGAARRLNSRRMVA